MAAVVHDESAVDGDVGNPFGNAPRLLVRRRVAHGLGVEADEVGDHPGPDEPAVGEAEPLRRERGHLPDRMLQVRIPSSRTYTAR